MSAETVVWRLEQTEPATIWLSVLLWSSYVDNECLTTKEVNKTKTMKQFVLLEIK